MVTRDSLWHPWGIDWKSRFSEYRTKLFLKKNVNFKKVELRLAIALSIFCGDTEEQACELMYAFGHPLTVVPSKYFTLADDINYGCYRIIRHVYANCASTASECKEEKEKKRVERLLVALEYISAEENGEQNLYAYFFGQKPKNAHMLDL